MSRPRRLSGLVIVSILGLALAACGSKDAASDSSDGTPSVTSMVGGIDKVIYLPAKLGDQLGYFKAAGVNAKFLTEPSGASAENVLIAGQVQGVVGFYDHTVTLQAGGKCIESVVQLAKVPGEAEVVANSQAATITGPSSFRGKRLGVTSLGSSTDYLTQYLATRGGLKKGEFTLVKAGAGPTFIASLKNGGIDAGMTTDPTIAQLTSTGAAKVLLDMRTEEGTRAALGGLYPAASMYMDCDYVQKNPKTVQKLVTGFVKTLGWINTHTPAEIAAKMPADYSGGNPELYVKSIKDSSPMFTTDGVMPEGGPQTVLNVLSTFNDAVKAKKSSIDLSKTYTTQFAKAAAS
jgi:NitT/TauT family transport system substrate-binding protein